jgi:hypothetical protein
MLFSADHQVLFSNSKLSNKSQAWGSRLFKALFKRDILTHNIAIKRYYDKNIFLSHGYLKAKVSS